ncbi:MAG: CDC48 family AAA ATPase [Candidatus Micrarchaeota archaeon]|nr:CDC48 family AAA ATPase [Candidatus Micrarchaeota archaeon]
MAVTNQIILKVAEALQNDVGRGLVRIDSKARKELNAQIGDIVELKGKKSTVAIVWQAHPQDEGLGIIRMDGYHRQNAGVSIGDKITVRKVLDVKEAKKIVFAPTAGTIKYTNEFQDMLRKKLIGKPCVRGDYVYIGSFSQSYKLLVVNVNPPGTVIITENTEIVLKEETVKEAGTVPAITYEDIGGLKEAIQKIREMVELPMRHPELFERLGIEPPKGVLIYGPPGTGKTLLAKAVASESEAHFIHIGGPELVSKFVGESEEKLRAIFKEAEEKAPSIIFMDEIDAIAPKREEVTGEVEKRVVSQLLTLMDGLKSRGQVVVIGATNRPNSIDPALRRPGRFDREIEIGIPDRDSRKEILQIHTRNMPLAEDVDLDELANITHGYTGADLNSLVKEAAMMTLRRILPDLDLEKEIPPEIINSLKVTKDDFMNAMKGIQASALREVFLERPNVKWSDIGGLEDVKRELYEAVELPLKKPDVFSKVGIRPLKGILLVGLPGNGKTLLAKAIAGESEANFISINGPEVFSKWVGESEKMIRELFRKARNASPCIIFIDEIDAIASTRSSDETNKVAERVVDTILTEMDGIRNLKGVVVIAATNRPDIVDSALLRPGRFDKIIEIPPPDEKARIEILKIHTRNVPLSNDVVLEEIAKRTNGFSGADLENLVREAGMISLRSKLIINENESLDKLTLDDYRKRIAELDTTNLKVEMQHFIEALKKIRPSIDADAVERMKKFAKGADLEMFR